MLAPATTLLAALLVAVVTFALPWIQGGVLLREQSVATASGAVVLATLMFAGRGKIGFGGGTFALAGLGFYGLAQSTLLESSVDAARSHAAAAQLFGAAAAMTAGATLFRRANAARVLLGGVVVSTVAVGTYGIVSVARGDRKIFGQELEVLAAPFGPFVNPNNAAGLLMIGLAGVIGLICDRLSLEDDFGDDRRPTRPEPTALLVAAAVLLLAALAATGSRSGLFTAVVSAGVTAVAARPRGRRGFIPITLAISLLLVVGASRLTDMSWIADEWARADELAEDARFSHWTEMLDAVRERPETGWGFGTYGQVSRKFVNSDRNLWWQHADSQWFETLVEGGAVGVGVSALFVFLLVVGAARRLNDPAGRLPAAACLGVTTGLALHSLFDSSVLASSVWVPAALVTGSGAHFRPSRVWLPFGVVVVGAALWGAWELHHASNVQRVAIDVPALRGASSASLGDARVLLERAEAVSAARPNDALGHWTRGRLLIHIARWEMTSDPPAPLVRQSGRVPWTLTDPAVLHSLSCGLDTEGLDSLRAHPAVGSPLSAGRDACRRAATLAPLWDQPLTTAATLAWIDTPPRDVSAASAASDVLPSYARTQLAAVRLAWSAGDLELLVKALHRLLPLTAEHDDQMIPQLASEFSVHEISRDFLPPDAAVLLRVAETQTTSDADPLRRALLLRAEDLLTGESDGDRRAALTSRASLLRGDVSTAEAVLRDRLDAEPGSPQTRRALAALLSDAGEYREALIEVRAAVASDRETPSDRKLERHVRAQLRSLQNRSRRRDPQGRPDADADPRPVKDSGPGGG